MDPYYETGETAKETVNRYVKEIFEHLDLGAKIEFSKEDHIYKSQKIVTIIVHYEDQKKA
jgi:hypothetical protein